MLHPAMKGMILGAMCALCCISVGFSKSNALRDTAHQAKMILEALEKMALQLRINPSSLPDLLKACAPEEDHFFRRLARAAEKSPALPPAQLIATAAPLPALPKTPLNALIHLLETLWGPDAEMQKKVLEEVLSLYRMETDRLQSLANQRGPLFLQLSLLGGCALFILFC